MYYQWNNRYERKRLTLDSDNGISNFIKVGEVQYPLAVGGHTVKGGDGGYSGNFNRSSRSESYTYAVGGIAGNPTAGNINGGGSNNYGFAGIAANEGRRIWRYNTGEWYVANADGHVVVTAADGMVIADEDVTAGQKYVWETTFNIR